MHWHTVFKVRMGWDASDGSLSGLFAVTLLILTPINTLATHPPTYTFLRSKICKLYLVSGKARQY